MSQVSDLVPCQVVLTVSDLATSIAFYEQFGFQAGSRICKPDGRSRVTLTARSSPGFELKLFTNPHAHANPELPELADYLCRVGTRYLSLRCEDIDKFYEHFKGKLTFVREPKNGLTGCRYAFVVDPDGILLEIYQPNYWSQVQSSNNKTSRDD